VEARGETLTGFWGQEILGTWLKQNGEKKARKNYSMVGNVQERREAPRDRRNLSCIKDLKRGIVYPEKDGG